MSDSALFSGKHPVYKTEKPDIKMSDQTFLCLIRFLEVLGSRNRNRRKIATLGALRFCAAFDPISSRFWSDVLQKRLGTGSKVTQHQIRMWTGRQGGYFKLGLDLVGPNILTLRVALGSRDIALAQRKTKGQLLKGKIVPALFHTFWHFPHIFTLFQSFSELYLQDFLLDLRGFTTVLVFKETKRELEIIKRKRPNHFARELLHVCPPSP